VFKDSVLTNWLKKYNPQGTPTIEGSWHEPVRSLTALPFLFGVCAHTEDQWAGVEDNFIRSCAGYCGTAARLFLILFCI
jgi:hypothetical protein